MMMMTMMSRRCRCKAYVSSYLLPDSNSGSQVWKGWLCSAKQTMTACILPDSNKNFFTWFWFDTVYIIILLYIRIFNNFSHHYIWYCCLMSNLITEQSNSIINKYALNVCMLKEEILVWKLLHLPNPMSIQYHHRSETDVDPVCKKVEFTPFTYENKNQHHNMCNFSLFRWWWQGCYMWGDAKKIDEIDD